MEYLTPDEDVLAHILEKLGEPKMDVLREYYSVAGVDIITGGLDFDTINLMARRRELRMMKAVLLCP